MEDVVAHVQAALRKAVATGPVAGGFPHLAETLRRAGVRRNEWQLPSMQRVYVTDSGAVMEQGVRLMSGMAEVAGFDAEALIAALRADQEGRATFEEFVIGAWRAGVVRWVVDLQARSCTYQSADGQSYVEHYPAVDLG